MLSALRGHWRRFIATASHKKGGQLFSVPIGGALVKQQFALGGSGSLYMYSWVDANYRPGMTAEEAAAFVTKGLSHAIARDGSSGGSARLVTLTEAGADVKYVKYDDLPFQINAETLM